MSMPRSLRSSIAIAALLTAGLGAKDPERLALELRAQTDFDRVRMMALPTLAGAGGCVQSQAALLSVSAPEDVPLYRYRKGYCELAQAVVTNSADEFLAAAADFDAAMEAWPARMAKTPKGQAPEGVSNGLRGLA